MAERGTRSKSSRSKVSESVKVFVLSEAGYMCGNPTCRSTLALEIHHIVRVSAGGGNEPSNLLPLCGHCHNLFHAQHIPEAAVRTWKAALLSLNNPNRTNADVLIHLSRMEENEIYNNLARYSPDALLHLAGLLNAGLITATFTEGSTGSWTGTFTQFRVELTEKGRLLVAAWLSGDDGRLKEALNIHLSRG